MLSLPPPSLTYSKFMLTSKLLLGLFTFTTSSNWVGVLFKTSFSSYLSSEPSIWSPPSEQNTYSERFSISPKYFLGSVWWYQPLITRLRRQTEALCESEVGQPGVEEEKEDEEQTSQGNSLPFLLSTKLREVDMPG